MGYNLDPLTLVIPVLVSARAISHAVQFVERFYEELEHLRDREAASRATMAEMCLPGLLGVVTDATGLVLIAVGAFPLNTKLAFYSTFWAASIAATVILLVPLLLVSLPLPRDLRLKHNALRRILPAIARVCTQRGAGESDCRAVGRAARAGVIREFLAGGRDRAARFAHPLSGRGL